MPAPAIVPVFPLPNVVFFPQTVLPLHVFEPRYRDLVRDVAAGDGRFSVALLRAASAAEDRHRPAFHAVATVGRIRDLRRLPDGRFLLELVGGERVRLDEVPSPHRYRLARATPIPERGPAAEDSTLCREKVDLIATVAYLARVASAGAVPALAFDDRRPFAAAVNDACSRLPVDPDARQRLLETDDLRERREAAARLASALLERALRGREPREPGTDAN